jgi:hypothetical protein
MRADPLRQIKGVARPILTFLRGSDVLRLLQCPDGSFSIVRNGQILGIWEACETADCLDALRQLLPPRDSTTLVLVVRKANHSPPEAIYN